MDIEKYLQERCAMVEQSLDRLLPATEDELANHYQAMRYSLLAGGKRIRPIIFLAAAEAAGGESEPLLPLAAAFECIHTYSLIHDDLPAMDDDDLRRGKPTCHKKYGEAAAILAGDGLLSFAFELLSRPLPGAGLKEAQQLRIVQNVAEAIGPQGMVGGQVMDIEAEGEGGKIDIARLKLIHRRKTGALISSAAECGAIAGGADLGQYQAISEYGRQAGLAFQIIDDLLNVTGDAESMGKATGSDAERGKATYPALLGLETAQKKADEAVSSAIAALSQARLVKNHALVLKELAQYIHSRRR